LRSANGDTPNSSTVTPEQSTAEVHEVLALPIYGKLADEQLEYVVGTMKEALERGAEA